ncbi:DUF4397 domain-containing protein [Meiothermus sp.]|uniref:DUF4397 domain-containing protein n=1 Tax=Meiothermus sp. TaxID=1955249 RepID=UPI00307D10E3
MQKLVWGVLFGIFTASALAANVRVSHLAPLAPSVDVYLNGQLKFRNVPFRGVTEYLAVPKGIYDVQVFRAGTNTQPIISAPNVNLGDGSYTITAAGRGDDKSYFPVVFSDQMVASPNQATVRLINASPDLRSIDLSVQNTELVQNVAYKSASSYLRFGPGQYNLEVRLSGFQTPMINIRNLRLEPGKIYTLFVVGLLEDNTLNYILAEDQPRQN